MNGIEIYTPPETFSSIDKTKDPRYKIVVVLDEDCAKALKVNRIHIFKNLDQLNNYFSTLSSNFDIMDSLIRFKTSTPWEYFGTIFWGFDHDEIETPEQNKTWHVSVISED